MNRTLSAGVAARGPLQPHHGLTNWVACIVSIAQQGQGVKEDSIGAGAINSQ